MKIVYVAGPFTAENAYEIHRNCNRAEEVGAEVARLGAMPLIPHNNTRNFHGLGSAEFWYEGTMELLRRADAIVLARGREASRGSRAEVVEAQRLGLPVFEAEYVGETLGTVVIPGLAKWVENGGER